MAKEKDNPSLDLIEVIQGTDLRIDRLSLVQSMDGERLKVWDPVLHDGKGGERVGQIFVSMPENLALALPGSELSPIRFLEALNVKDDTGGLLVRLVGEHVWVESDPAFHFKEKGFSLTVFHGQINPMTMRMSKLATTPEDQRTDEVRGEYQYNLNELLAPIINTNSLFDVVLRDDCLASGDSVIGSLAALVKLEKIELSGKKLRVDVAVATHQGILLLRQFAKQNQIDLDLYVGSTADALSKGVPIKGQSINMHENYIEYSQTRRSQWGDKIIQVVGDMGDFLKSLLEKYDAHYPWNKFRKGDGHGSRGEQAPIIIDWGSSPYVLYLTNGGFGIKAFYDLQKAVGNPVVFSAKRVHARDHGYGVLIDGI